MPSSSRLRNGFLGGVLTLSIFAVTGCGGGGSFFATVPPPVEFSATPRGSAEMPKTGTYAGTVLAEHVTYHYLAPGASGQRGRWVQESAVPLGAEVAAEAVIGDGGAITLRYPGASTNLFTGILEVDNSNPSDVKAKASLEAFDGTSAVYPFAVKTPAPRVLYVAPHGKTTTGDQSRLSFDRYSFTLQLG